MPARRVAAAGLTAAGLTAAVLAAGLVHPGPSPDESPAPAAGTPGPSSRTAAPAAGGSGTTATDATTDSEGSTAARSAVAGSAPAGSETRPAHSPTPSPTAGLAAGTTAQQAGTHLTGDDLVSRRGTDDRVSQRATTGKPPRRVGPVQAARGFLAANAASFGLRDPGRELRTSWHLPSGSGGSVVRFRQVRGGLPVLGGEIAVAVDAAGKVLSANGETSDAPVPDAAEVSAEEARATAIRTTGRAHRRKASGLGAPTPSRWLYDPALIGAPDPAGARPVWRVDVSSADAGDPVSDLVLVDAATGGVALRIDQQPHALDRRVCDFRNGRVREGAHVCTDALSSRREGGAATRVADVDAAYAYFGHTDAFYRRLGRDGVLPGRALRGSVRIGDWCPISGECQPLWNAFYDDAHDQMVFGTGFTADDVVGHELTHAVTADTSGLLYAFESGAINESMSDVVGELVDQGNGDSGTRWLVGEDTPLGALRDMRSPTRYSQPDRMRSPLWQAADPYFADAGNLHTNSGVGNKAAYLIVDGGSFNGRTVTGLGAVKAARVYFAAMQLLTEGSSYADLYRVLPQACRNNVGVDGITEANCAEVQDAVAATEMNLAPVVPGAGAPVCPTGTTRQDWRRYDFETATTQVTFDRGRYPSAAHGWYRLPEEDPTGRGLSLARLGTHSAWAIEPAVRATDYRADRYLTLASDVRVPAGRATYLRFGHLHAFEAYPRLGDWPEFFGAGGRVEYSLDTGRTWVDLGPRFVNNGYNATVDPDNYTPAAANGPLPRFRGFGGASPGWLTSRADLSTLAGRTVRFRFRLTSDATDAVLGWFADDVQVYSCGGPTPTTAQRLTGLGGVGAATVTWTPPAWAGSAGAVRGYVVTARPVGGTGRTLTLRAAGTSARLTGLPGGTTYDVAVAASNPAGSGRPVVVRLSGVVARLGVSSGTVRSGANLHLAGSLTRADTQRPLPGARVQLVRRARGTPTWSPVATATTSRSGTVTLTLRMRGSGRFDYALRYGGGPGLLGASTAPRPVVVRR